MKKKRGQGIVFAGAQSPETQIFAGRPHPEISQVNKEPERKWAGTTAKD